MAIGEDLQPSDDRVRDDLRRLFPRPAGFPAGAYVRQLLATGRMLGETPKIGRYALEKVLGEGGMGVVVRAVDTNFGVTVALKVLDGKFEPEKIPAEQRAAWLQHVHHEAKRLMEVHGDHVVHVYDADIVDGFRWLAMQYIEGVDLEQRFLDPARPPPLPWQTIVRWFVDAARGLQSVHDAGLVHRDMKPHNVVLDSEDRRACLVDFGLVMVAATARPDEQTSPDMRAEEGAATRRCGPPADRAPSRTAAGTEAYMSPEQLRGAALDARSDQFSLCLSLYWALYGRMPFDDEAPTAALVERRLGLPRHPPRHADSVPRWLHDLVARGLAARPEDRYASMRALIQELTRARGGRTLWLTALAVGTTASVLFSLVGAPHVRSMRCRDHGATTREPFDALHPALAARYGDAGADVADNLADLAGRWGKGWDAACDDYFVEGQPGLELRQQCLGRRWRDLERLAGDLTTAEIDLPAARRAIRRLGDPEVCDAAGYNRATPPSEAQALEIPLVEDNLSSARIALSLGDYTAAQRDARAAVARAAACGHAPTTAAAHIVAGRIARERNIVDDAEASLTAADRAALAGRDVFAAIDTSHELARLAILEQKDLGRARLLLEQAAGHLDDAGWGAPPECRPEKDRACFHHTHLFAEHADLRGLLDYAGLRYEDAEAHHRRAIAAREPLIATGAEPGPLAHSWLNLGRALLARGRRNEADAAYATSQRLLALRYPPDHPAHAADYFGIAEAARQRGDYDDAAANAEWSRALYVEAEGVDSPSVARVDYLLGVIWLDRQDFARARQSATAALATWGRVTVPSAQDVARVRQLLAAITKEEGDLATAADLYTAVVPLFAGIQGADTRCDEALAWVDLGKCQFRVDRAAALAAWDRAGEALALAGGSAACPAGYELVRARGDLADHEGDHATALKNYQEAAADPQITSAVLADVRWGIARNMVHLGKDLTEARDLAVKARAAYRSQGPGGKILVALIDRWLSSHM